MAISKQLFRRLRDNLQDNIFSQFNVKIDIVNLVKVSDGMGGFTQTEQNVITNYDCFVSFDAGGETTTNMLGAEQIQVKDEIMFSMKPVSVLNESMIIKYNNHSYNIQSIDNLAGADIWLRVKAVKNDGK